MSAYNFQKQFVPLIERGEKKSTIRRRRKNGYLPRVGDVIGLWQGLRTRAARLIRRAPVVRVTPITINAGAHRGTYPEVVLGAHPLSLADIEGLAKRDGFASVDAFRAFFFEKYGLFANLYLIEWE